MRYVAILILLVLSLANCSGNGNKQKKEIKTVALESFANTLFYSGTILPIKSMVVTSPAEGVVIDMPYQYGEKVNLNDLIFTISSSKFFSDYKNALLSFIKAKNEFNTSKTQLTEAKFLHKHQLISDDDFKLKQSSFYSARLSLLQAKDTLQDLLHQSNMININLNSLSIADIDKITNAMHLKNNSQHLKLLAPSSGILLSTTKGEEENKKIAKGDVVKQGDVLAIIGDMSGLSVRIKVNELTVNQIKPGQKVSITGIAFPDETLHGEVMRVDRQGEQGSSGGTPNFSVEIVVKHLSERQARAIHVGMSAKIELDIEEQPRIIVPLSFVYDKDGETYIDVYDAKLRQSHSQRIKTGKTTFDSVVVLSGLNAGDKIVSAH